MENKYNNRTKIVKKALADKFGNKNVSVHRGRGTASSWVECKVTLDFPKNCNCKFVTKQSNWGNKPYLFTYRGDLGNIHGNNGYTCYCVACKDLLIKTSEQANIIVNNCGAEFSHYYADDGYSTERREVIVEVEVGKFENKYL